MKTVLPPISSARRTTRRRRVAAILACALAGAAPSWADSVNSPNITINADTNRVGGPLAGGVSITVNTITIAETMLPEYSSGAGKTITMKVKPGFGFDPASAVSAQSATIGINGGAVGAAANVVPAGTADEVLTFSLTSGTSTTVQDIIRLNGIKIRIIDSRGAVGPAQSTLTLTTATAGGAFTDQGIVAANIQKGAAQRLLFATQPGSTQSGQDLLPSVTMVDFGGNIVTNDPRTITLAIQSNPAAGTLAGVTSRATSNGVATWVDADNLSIAAAGTGYTLRATHNGTALPSADTVDSAPFDILAGPPNRMQITRQPVNTAAGADILIDVSVFDAANNLVTTPVNVTLDSAVNPGGWPLLSANGLTKTTVNGVASWSAADDLRINKATTGYRLAVSGVGATLFSDLFNITAAAPAAVEFVQQPSDTTQGVAINPAITTQIVDAFENPTASTAEVQLSLDASSCSGTVAGAARPSVAGVATFAAVSIDTACVAAKLEAASSGLVGATSDAFVVAAAPNANNNANADGGNDNANDNGEDPGDIPIDMNPGGQCGACGAGASMALAPMLLAMTFARITRRRTRC